MAPIVPLSPLRRAARSGSRAARRYARGDAGGRADSAVVQTLMAGNASVGELMLRAREAQGSA